MKDNIEDFILSKEWLFLRKDQCNPIKNHPEFESGFNLMIYRICEPISTFLHDHFDISPNQITLFSLPFCYLSVKTLKEKNPICVVYFFLYTVLDYLDGYYARKYNQVTRLGDIFDHIRDLYVMLSIFVVLFNPSVKESLPMDNWIFVICLLFLYLTFKSFGCQEEDYKCDKDPSVTTKWSKMLCSESFKHSSFNKNVGTGGFYVLYMALMWYYVKR